MHRYNTVSNPHSSDGNRVRIALCEPLTFLSLWVQLELIFSHLFSCCKGKEFPSRVTCHGRGTSFIFKFVLNLLKLPLVLPDLTAKKTVTTCSFAVKETRCHLCTSSAVSRELSPPTGLQAPPRRCHGWTGGHFLPQFQIVYRILFFFLTKET